MVHFFGILSPISSKRSEVETTPPGKVSFFGGVTDFAFGSVPMSRAEQDACFLAERWPEPAEDVRYTAPAFVRFRSPTRL
jgi:hypothetical protein